jgi:hypothetical protein
VKAIGLYLGVARKLNFSKPTPEKNARGKANIKHSVAAIRFCAFTLPGLPL